MVLFRGFVDGRKDSPGVLHARFGIDHTTIQLEREPEAPLQIRARVGGGARTASG